MALSVYYNPKSLFLLILEGTESLTFQSNFTEVYEMSAFHHFRIIAGLVPYGPEPVLRFFAVVQRQMYHSMQFILIQARYFLRGKMLLSLLHSKEDEISEGLLSWGNEAKQSIGRHLFPLFHEF